MSLCFHFTEQGDRDENLDRFVHLECNGFNISFIMDGFFNKNPDAHYIDYFVSEISKVCLAKYDMNNACDFIIDVINSDEGFDGKSTLSMVVYDDEIIRYISIGDSRIYFLDNKERTKDDSVAQRLVDSGFSHESSIPNHPYRNRLLKFVSKKSKHQELSFKERRLNKSEKVVFCTDGFWCHCKDDVIWDMDTEDKVNNAFSAVISCGLGSLDNVSVALLVIQEQGNNNNLHR